MINRKDLAPRGAGEPSTRPVAAAIANAVEDALQPFDAIVRSGPLTPSRIRDLVRDP